MCKMKAIAVLLITVLVYQQTSALAQMQSDVKAQLDKIPISKTIEVRLLREDNNKIKGKLVSVANDSFEVQTVKSGKASNETIAFADVKSVKKSGMSVGKKIMLSILAIFGAMSIYILARGDD